MLKARASSRISPARAGLRRYLPSGGDQGTAGISLFRLLPRARAGLAEPAGHLLHPMTVIRRRKGHEPTGIRCPSGSPTDRNPCGLGAHPQARDATVCPKRDGTLGPKVLPPAGPTPPTRPSGLGHPASLPSISLRAVGKQAGSLGRPGQDLCRCRGDSNAVKKIHSRAAKQWLRVRCHGLGPCPAGCGHHNESGSPRPPGDSGHPLRIAYSSHTKGATGNLAGSPSAYPVMTKADHPKVPAAREQRPYLTASVAADHRDMTSTANAAQAPGEAGP